MKTVFPELTKNSWLVLLSLAQGPKKASEIARENNMEDSRVSEALARLEEFNILKERQRKKPIVLDSSLKNALKEFMASYSKERLAECLEGKKLNVLLQISEGYDNVAKLKAVTGYSTPTINRVLKRTQDCLFVYLLKKGTYRIRDEILPKVEALRTAFYSCFLDSLEMQGIEWSRTRVFGNVVLIKSTQRSIPGFVRTGFSLFHDYDVEIMETNDNYFVNFERKPGRKEIFVHALAFSEDARDFIFCVLFADLNRLTPQKTMEIAAIYKVEKEVQAIFEFLKTRGKVRADFLPSYEEYASARKDYAD